MVAKKFSDWVAMREQVMMGASAGGAPSPIDAEIKQVQVSSAGKPKAAREAALKALVKKKQGDPRVKPADIEKINSAFPGADDDKTP
jgi:hypothetical protein